MKRLNKHVHRHLMRRAFYKLKMLRIARQLLSIKMPKLEHAFAAMKFTMPQQGTKVLKMRRYEETNEDRLA